MAKKDETHAATEDQEQAPVETVVETAARVLLVTSIKDGFRRGGRAWYGTTEVLASEFTAEQLVQIMAEKLLRVEVKD